EHVARDAVAFGIVLLPEFGRCWSLGCHISFRCSFQYGPSWPPSIKFSRAVSVHDSAEHFHDDALNFLILSAHDGLVLETAVLFRVEAQGRVLPVDAFQRRPRFPVPLSSRI